MQSRDIAGDRSGGAGGAVVEAVRHSVNQQPMTEAQSVSALRQSWLDTSTGTHRHWQLAAPCQYVTTFVWVTLGCDIGTPLAGSVSGYQWCLPEVLVIRDSGVMC
jgi:hypothetical protein